MPQLRWTLLGLGVLFIILLVWVERRRQRRTFSEITSERESTGPGDAEAYPVFREPALTLPEMRAREIPTPHELPVVEIEDDSLTVRTSESNDSGPEPSALSLPVMSSGPVARRQGEPTVSGMDELNLADSGRFAIGDVPRLDKPARTGRSASTVLERANLADHDEKSFNDAVFGQDAEPGLIEIEADYTPAELTSGDTEAPESDEDADTDEDSESDEAAEDAEAAPTEPRFTVDDIAPIVEPIVEWPPDDQRRIVALRLVASPTERIAGRALRLALASEGFILGKFSIFHKPDDHGRAVLSAASLSKPGTFDIDTMDVARYSGLSLFAVLPGPKPPLKAFEELLSTARSLNERLSGALQDERGGPLTPTRIATLREALSAEPQ